MVTLELTNQDGGSYGENSSLDVVADMIWVEQERIHKRIEAIHKNMNKSVVKGGHGRSETALDKLVTRLAVVYRLREQVVTHDYYELQRLALNLGWEVEEVEYCESADSPGLLGAGLGVAIYGKKLVRIKVDRPTEEKAQTLNHELDHVRHPKIGQYIDMAWWKARRHDESSTH